jgi:hypothetical protein
MKVRYPTKVMVRMKQHIKQSFKNAGFGIFWAGPKFLALIKMTGNKVVGFYFEKGWLIFFTDFPYSLTPCVKPATMRWVNRPPVFSIAYL